MPNAHKSPKTTHFLSSSKKFTLKRLVIKKKALSLQANNLKIDKRKDDEIYSP
jgi:hypothetical protein